MSHLCSELPVIVNGLLKLQPNEKPPFNLNDSLNFECDLGYGKTNSSKKCTCVLNENGIAEWSNTTCLPNSCGEPPFLINGTRSGGRFMFSNSVRYTCDSGYKMIENNIEINEKIIFCHVSGKWSNNLTNVRCDRITCPELSNPRNGTVKYLKRYVDSIATYNCDKKFMLVGNVTRKCLLSGMWDGSEPLCKIVLCSKPEVPPNAFIIQSFIKPSYEAGDIVVFVLDGKQLSTKCDYNGIWTHLKFNVQNNSKASDDNLQSSIKIQNSNTDSEVNLQNSEDLNIKVQNNSTTSDNNLQNSEDLNIKAQNNLDVNLQNSKDLNIKAQNNSTASDNNLLSIKDFNIKVQNPNNTSNIPNNF